MLAAGDIASCDSNGDEQTAALLDHESGTVLTLGDNVYESGTLTEFENCYAPSWGRDKYRTKPSVGNHEYKTPGANGYFQYFGAAAGNPKEGYYSFNLGAWHLIALNSNCSDIGGCGTGSPEERWLRSDLAAHPAQCTLAYWHHPRWTSGVNGDDPDVGAFWTDLYDAHADLILNGHDHDYERFAPQDPSERQDYAHGIREIVVGTGGRSHTAFQTTRPNSQVRNNDTYGILKLVLHPTSYDWRFIPVAGKTFTDSAYGVPCH